MLFKKVLGDFFEKLIIEHEAGLTPSCSPRGSVFSTQQHRFFANLTPSRQKAERGIFLPHNIIIYALPRLNILFT